MSNALQNFHQSQQSLQTKYTIVSFDNLMDKKIHTTYLITKTVGPISFYKLYIHKLVNKVLDRSYYDTGKNIETLETQFLHISTLQSQNCANRIKGSKHILVLACTVNGAVAIARTDKQAELLVDVHSLEGFEFNGMDIAVIEHIDKDFGMSYNFVAVTFNGVEGKQDAIFKAWEILVDIRPDTLKNPDSEALVVNHVDFEDIVKYSFVNKKTVNVHVSANEELMIVSDDISFSFQVFQICPSWMHISYETKRCSQNPLGYFSLDLPKVSHQTLEKYYSRIKIDDRVDYTQNVMQVA